MNNVTAILTRGRVSVGRRSPFYRDEEASSTVNAGIWTFKAHRTPSTSTSRRVEQHESAVTSFVPRVSASEKSVNICIFCTQQEILQLAAFHLGSVHFFSMFLTIVAMTVLSRAVRGGFASSISSLLADPSGVSATSPFGAKALRSFWWRRRSISERFWCCLWKPLRRRPVSERLWHSTKLVRVRENNRTNQSHIREMNSHQRHNKKRSKHTHTQETERNPKHSPPETGQRTSKTLLDKQSGQMLLLFISILPLASSASLLFPLLLSSSSSSSASLFILSLSSSLPSRSKLLRKFYRAWLGIHGADLCLILKLSFCAIQNLSLS